MAEFRRSPDMSPHLEETQKIKEQMVGGKVTIPKRSGKFAEGTNPNIFDPSIKSGVIDTTAFDKRQLAGEVKKGTADWEADDLKSLKEASQAVKDAADERQINIAQDNEIRDDAAWNAAKERALADHARQDKQKELSDKEAQINQAMNARGVNPAKIHEDIKNNPQGKLGKLFARLQNLGRSRK